MVASLSRYQVNMSATRSVPPSSAPSSPPTGALERIRLRNDYYVDGYRASQTIAVLVSVICVLSIAMNFYQASRPPEPPKYFAVKQDGSLTPIVPLSDPLMNQSQLSNWVAKAVSQAFTLDAKNYVSQINANSILFTNEGFDQYKAALNESSQLRVIKEKVMITTAVVNGAPVIVDAMRTQVGTLMWKIQVPMTVQYASSKESYVQSVIVNLIVTRVPTTISEYGVAITQMTSKIGSR